MRDRGIIEGWEKRLMGGKKGKRREDEGNRKSYF